MPHNDNEAGSNRWSACSLTVTEAKELAWLDIFVPPDMRIPKGWKLSLVPPVDMPTFAIFNRAVHLFRAGLMLEVRAVPEHDVASQLWHGILSEWRNELLNCYAGNVPPYQHNR